MVAKHERVIDWLARQVAFMKANHLEDCIMTNDGDLKMDPDRHDRCTLIIYDDRFPSL